MVVSRTAIPDRIPLCPTRAAGEEGVASSSPPDTQATGKGGHPGLPWDARPKNGAVFVAVSPSVVRVQRKMKEAVLRGGQGGHNKVLLVLTVEIGVLRNSIHPCRRDQIDVACMYAGH